MLVHRSVHGDPVAHDFFKCVITPYLKTAPYTKVGACLKQLVYDIPLGIDRRASWGDAHILEALHLIACHAHLYDPAFSAMVWSFTLTDDATATMLKFTHQLLTLGLPRPLTATLEVYYERSLPSTCIHMLCACPSLLPTWSVLAFYSMRLANFPTTMRLLYDLRPADALRRNADGRTPLMHLLALDVHGCGVLELAYLEPRALQQEFITADLCQYTITGHGHPEPRCLQPEMMAMFREMYGKPRKRQCVE